jgi:hypothetical protein
MPAQPPHLSLLHLPAEVRLEVYKHYFTQDHPIRVPPLPRSKPFGEWRNISLLVVSKQTYAEAFAIFYQTNTFWIVRDTYPYGPFSDRARRLIKALRFGTSYPEIWVSCLFISPCEDRTRQSRIVWDGIVSKFPNLESLDLGYLTVWWLLDVLSELTLNTRPQDLTNPLTIEIQFDSVGPMVPPDPGAETTKSVLRQAFDPDHKPEKPLDLHPVLKVIRLRCRLPNDVCKFVEQHHFEHWEVRRTSSAPTKDGYAYVQGLRFQARQ